MKVGKEGEFSCTNKNSSHAIDWLDLKFAPCCDGLKCVRVDKYIYKCRDKDTPGNKH